MNLSKEQATLQMIHREQVDADILGTEGEKCKVSFFMVFENVCASDESNVRYRLTPIRIERFFVCLKSVTPIAIWIAAQLLTPPCDHPSVTWPPTILFLTFWMQFLPYLFDDLHMHVCMCLYLHRNSCIIYTSRLA